MYMLRKLESSKVFRTTQTSGVLISGEPLQTENHLLLELLLPHVHLTLIHMMNVFHILIVHLLPCMIMSWKVPRNEAINSVHKRDGV